MGPKLTKFTCKMSLKTQDEFEKSEEFYQCDIFIQLGPFNLLDKKKSACKKIRVRYPGAAYIYFSYWWHRIYTL